MVPIMLWFEFRADFFRSPVLNGIVLAIVAALMVSRVPTFSLKRLRVPREWILPVLLVVGAAAAFLTTEPWATLLCVGVIYIGSIPVSIYSYHRLRRAAEGARPQPRELQPPQADAESPALRR
jgi:CDP-diacylglycerol--serine O-phosphatidyltransferase